MAEETKAKADKKPKVKKAFGPFDGATEIVGPDKKTHVIPAGVKATFHEEKVWVLEKNKV